MAQQRRLFLSTLPASAAERRVALAIVLVSLALFLAAAPFAKVQLPRLDAFIPIYESALIINDLVTAVLLFGQFSILRSRALLVLACGYLFTALMVVAHMLSFPGLFAESGLLGSGPQTTAWIYMFWHGGFPLMVMAYALLPQPADSKSASMDSRASILVSSFAVLVAVGAIVGLTTTGQALLPPIMDGSHYTPAMKFVVGTVCLMSPLALGLLWRRKPHSMLDLWLMVVMFAWLCDVALSAVLNAGRFDLGFYAGRIFGFAATSFVLSVLLLETRALYARLAQSLEAERAILQQANAELEQRVRERSRQLEAEIAERERVQESLRETQKLEAIGRTAGGIAHDFNNLLTIIQGNAELLLDRKLSPADRDAVQAIDRATDRGVRLIRQILTFSRRQPLKIDVVDLRERCDEITGMLSQTVRGDIGLVIDFADDIGPIECDVTELEVALMNLCVNARDAMPEGGSVRVAGSNCTLDGDERLPNLAGEFVALSVTDTGAGIAPKDMPRVFEPFFTTKELGKGTGLGLSQVYGFAQQTGGSVIIDSKVGEGTTVTIYLPRAKSAATAAAATAHDPVRRAKGTVLLVEDDENVAKVALKMLQMIGYRPEHARDGGTALALLLGGQKFDVVFSDILMPGGMSGLDLARRIRQHFPRMPILLSTGYARAAGEVHREGFSIIAKPYRTDSLAAALARTIADSEQSANQSRDLA
jgi:signal transduction histidine kinase/ActR/RegA family two-component response regulator